MCYHFHVKYMKLLSLLEPGYSLQFMVERPDTYSKVSHYHSHTLAIAKQRQITANCLSDHSNTILLWLQSRDRSKPSVCLITAIFLWLQGRDTTTICLLLIGILHICILLGISVLFSSHLVFNAVTSTSSHASPFQGSPDYKRDAQDSGVGNDHGFPPLSLEIFCLLDFGNNNLCPSKSGIWWLHRPVWLFSEPYLAWVPHYGWVAHHHPGHHCLHCAGGPRALEICTKFLKW